MKEVKIASWDEFEKTTIALDEDVRTREKNFREGSRSNSIGEKTPFPTNLLFRGQANSEWKLETTLERATNRSDMRIVKYYRMLHRVKPVVESVFGRKWELNYEECFEDGDFKALQASDFFVYLRQYGFPSPLLDWTRSPYIAAYFAYTDATEASDVAIYSYVQDYHHSARSGCSGNYESRIVSTYVTTAPRHFSQQANYCYFIKEDDEKGWVFTNAEKALEVGNSHENDLIVKYILPASEKDEVLRRLDMMNVNAYTLFGTEESLLRDLFIRENRVK